MVHCRRPRHTRAPLKQNPSQATGEAFKSRASRLGLAIAAREQDSRSWGEIRTETHGPRRPLFTHPFAPDKVTEPQSNQRHARLHQEEQPAGHNLTSGSDSKQAVILKGSKTKGVFGSRGIVGRGTRRKSKYLLHSNGNLQPPLPQPAISMPSDDGGIRHSCTSETHRRAFQSPRLVRSELSCVYMYIHGQCDDN